MTSPFIRIGDRRVGEGEPVYVIAEAGVNHNGELDAALKLIDAAAAAGADAVKFQTFQVDQLVTSSAPKAPYQVRTTGKDDGQAAMLNKLALGHDAFKKLKKHADKRKIEFLSSPFDIGSLDFLVDIGVPAIKLGSGELTNCQLVARAGASGLPTILSTGMAVMGEVESGLVDLASGRAAAGHAGPAPVALLHCVSNYPAQPDDVNLAAIDLLRATFGVTVGYSDHTLGTDVAPISVALGATIIEKHVTLDRTLPGPDHEASLEPDEFRDMVRKIRLVRTALGARKKAPADCEREVMKVARRSLVAARDIPAGRVLTAEMIAVKRPATGIPPREGPRFLGLKTKRAVARDELLDWTMVARDA